MPVPDAVIFDCDGLLLDTESAWTRAEEVLYARHGGEFTAAHKREMVGTSGPVATVAMERHLGLPGKGPALQAELHVLVHFEVEQAAPPMPGAAELVAALCAEGIPIGLASNSPRSLVELALRTAGLQDAFASVLCAQDVARPKPAPDVYFASAMALGAQAGRTFALEDSPTGVAAAVAAGMFVIGVPSMDGVDLSAADLVAGSLRSAEIWECVGLRPAA